MFSKKKSHYVIEIYRNKGHRSKSKGMVKTLVEYGALRKRVLQTNGLDQKWFENKARAKVRLMLRMREIQNDDSGHI